MRVSLFDVSKLIGSLAVLGLMDPCLGQDKMLANGSQKNRTEPIFRIARVNDLEESNPATATDDKLRIAKADSAPPANLSVAAPPITASTPHPLDRAIVVANDSLQRMQQEIFDYTGLLVRREQVNGVLQEPSYMQMKIRCPRQTTQGQVPFSIYMKFLKPKAAAGRECIWVDGLNDSKIIAHESGGLLGLKRFYLDPTGFLAMRESRYPIFDAGIENLIVKLIEKAERDKALGPCQVDYRDNGEINGRKCDIIELCHPQKCPTKEFYKAQVFIDQETGMPIRYACYDWPDQQGAAPKLIEEYIYLNLKFNVGLTPNDFNPDNPSYQYPRR